MAKVDLDSAFKTVLEGVYTPVQYVAIPEKPLQCISKLIKQEGCVMQAK